MTACASDFSEGRKSRRAVASSSALCSCKGAEPMCPVHTLWDKFFAHLPDGTRPWAAVSAGKSRDKLRQTLGRLQVPNASEYGTHDLRRGHAEVSCLCSIRPRSHARTAEGYAQKRLHTGADFDSRTMEVRSISEVSQRGDATPLRYILASTSVCLCRPISRKTPPLRSPLKATRKSGLIECFVLTDQCP